MSDWKECTIKDIASDDKYALSTGPFGSAISSQYFKIEGVPVIRGGNLSPDVGKRLNDDGLVFIDQEKAKEFKRSVARRGDLIFTCWGTINQIGLIDKSSKYSEYIVSNKQMKLTPDLEKADSEFLYYLFSGPDKQSEILNNGIGAAVPGFNLGQLKSHVVQLPPLPEQKAIASVLSSLDDKIDLLHRQNKTLEAIAETLFRQWFIEEAQADWEEATIGDFVKLNRASTDKNYPYQIIEYLDTGSLTEGKIESFQSFTLDEAPSRAKRLVQHNDVLISTVRPNQKHYGIIKNPIENLVVSTGFCVITCTRIDPHFIYLLLTNDEMTSYLHTIAEGSTSTYPSLKPSDIGALSFQLPPKDKLKDFSAIAHHSWEKIEKNHIQIRTLERLRDTLLPKLMSGEVRVAS